MAWRDIGPAGLPIVGWPTWWKDWTATNTNVISKCGERPSTMCIKVLLADDTAIMRKAIRSGATNRKLRWWPGRRILRGA
jgi:hypothetical protein